MRKKRKLKYIIFLVIWSIILLIGLSTIANSIGLGTFIMLLSTIGIIYCFNKRSKKSLDTWELKQIYMTAAQLRALVSGKIPVIEYSGLVLKKDEKCLYACKGIRLITTNQIVSYSSKTSSTRVRITKGVSVGSSRTIRKPNRADVTSSFTGTFVVTNQRIAFLSNRKGFNLKYAEITSFLDDEFGIQMQADKEYYTINMVRPQYPRAIIKAYLKASNT